METRQPVSHQQLVKEAFMRCFSAESNAARDQLLEQLKSENRAIAEEVISLLDASNKAGAIEQIFGFTGHESLAEIDPGGPSNGGPRNRLSTIRIVAKLGTMIGPYKLLEQIGEGGMGSVYMAQQLTPIKRRVALKIIKPGMDTQQVIARFEAERQALAMMDHSSIAKVLDAGTTQHGRPYFVMELVKGVPITEYCSGEKLATKDRLELFTDLCYGVQHAHQKGIIHRDLKPSNVLVTLNDGRPVVKIIDFGIAKAVNQELTDRTFSTHYSQMIGTPLYMSPEQATLSSMDVDTRSDVYSLGVLLYELLTDSTPFDKALLKGVGIDEIRRMIRETEPPRPSQRIGQSSNTLKAANDSTLRVQPTPAVLRAQRELKGELDWIVMKALEKERNRRYESPNAFAADVERYVSGQPVLACPPTPIYRIRNYVKRHRRLLTMTAFIITTAIIGSAFSLRYANQASIATRNAQSSKVEAESHAKQAKDHAMAAALAAETSAEATRVANRAKRNAMEEKLKAEHILYTSDLRLAALQVNDGLHNEGFNTLVRHSPDETKIDRRSWEWYYLLNQANRNQLSWIGHSSSISQTDWSSDGRRIATASHDGYARIWDASSGKILREWLLGTTILKSIKWSPDGKSLAWGSAADEGILRVWEESSETVIELSAHKGSIWSIAWNQDGTRILTGSIPYESSNRGIVDDRNLVLWRKNGRLWEIESRHSMEGNVSAVGWNFAQDYIAAVTSSSSLRIFHAKGLELKYEVSDKFVRHAAWSPKKNLLIYGNATGECVLFDADLQIEMKRFPAHFGAIQGIAWSPDGNWLATGGDDGMVHIWDASDWKLRRSFGQHRGSVYGLSWDPNSERVVSVGADQFVNICSLKDKPPFFHVAANVAQESDRFAWTPNSCLRVIDNDSSIIDIAPLTGEILQTYSMPSSGSWLLLSRDLAIQRTSPIEVLLLGNRGQKSQWNLTSLHFIFCAAPDGSEILALSSDHIAKDCFVFKIKSNRESVFGISPMYSQLAASFSPSGTMVASVGKGIATDDGNIAHAGWLHLFNLSDRLDDRRVQVGNNRIAATSVSWSSDSKRLVAGTGDGVCEVFDADQLRRQVSNYFHRGSVNTISWHPNEQRIASGGDDRTVKVWDAGTGDILLSFPMEEKVVQVEWSIDGMMLAAKDSKNRIRVWNAAEGYLFADSNSYWSRVLPQKETAMHAAINIENWSAAKEVATQILELSKSRNVEQDYTAALLCVIENDLLKYGDICNHVIGNFSRLEPADHHDLALWTCCLSPASLIDYSLAIELAQEAVEKYSARPDGNLTLGSLQMRAGHYDEAAIFLERAKKQMDGDSIYSTVYCDYFLAMNSYFLGDRDAALKHLRFANVAAETELKATLVWNRKLTIQLLKNEANELVQPDLR